MNNNHRPIIIWLLTGCFLIFLMVVIGGITRLTNSGLSITEWNVIMGTIPPISEEDWLHVFNQYKQFPEYKYINHRMNLDEFKFIFFWEFLHRFVGRIIGIVFLVPFVWFVVRKKVSKPLMKKLLFIFFLGGFQGFLGWFMVKSGLQDNPHVSHYRLAAHLLTAFFTFGFLFHTSLGLIYEGKNEFKNGLSNQNFSWLRKFALLFFVTLCIQITYGAFVAGLKAGTVYNTFPLMGNVWMPDSVTGLNPWWQNFLSNMAGVQFVHRCIAWLLFFMGIYLYYKVHKMKLYGILRKTIHYILAILLLQLFLGILTLLYSVPLWLGVTHQAVAFFLFSSGIFFIFATETSGKTTRTT